MKGFLLTLIALILFMVFAPIGIVWQMIRNLRGIGNYFFKIAVCIDQAGGVVCSQIMNDIMIKKGGHEFSNPDETVSSIIGKNRESNTLTIIGLGLYILLDTIEPYHAEKAIEKDEESETKN